MKRIAPLLCSSLLLLAPSSYAASVTQVGVDETTNDAWRTTDVIKPFGDADNVYGTDGYFIAQYPDGDPNNVSQPSYATIELVGGRGYEGNGAEAHQSIFDDVLATGPGPVADLVAGDYWVGNTTHLAEDDFFTITLLEDTSFRLGVIGDVTPDNPPGLLYESSSAVRVTGPGGVDSGLVDILPMKNADVDYVLFDITGEVGDVFTVFGQNWFPNAGPDGWDANALGGVFVDPPSNPAAPQILTFAADPTQISALGAPVTFTWEVDGPLDSLLLQPGDHDLLPQNGGANSLTLDPGPDETTVYTLEATLGGETGTATTRVVLLPPEIVTFTTNKNLVTLGGEAILSWEVTPPYTTLTLQPGDIDLLGNTDANGVGSIAVSPLESTTFQVVAGRGPSSFSVLEALVQVRQLGQGITIVGIDIETNDAWRTTDVVKPLGDADNVYGTDGYFIAQGPNGDPINLSPPPYATVDLVPGKGYEGVGAEAHQSSFDDVSQAPGPGPIPDLVCGDYWANSGPTGTEDEFFTITLTQDVTFRLGVITDCTPDNPPGLLFESAVGVRVLGPDGVDSGIVDVAGPNEEWRNADVDYVLFDIKGSAGDVYTVWGVNDARWEANALGGVFFDPSGGPSGPQITDVSQQGGMLTISWESKGGNLYNLRSEADPAVIASVDPAEWPIWDGNENMVATPTENTLTFPLPADPSRLFVIEEFPAPPETIYAENFDAGDGGWTTGSEGDLGTLWELGSPSNVGPVAAHSGTNCFATNIDDGYTINTVVWLRSPSIDLSNAGGATLNFYQFVDIEFPAGQQFFDWGTVSVLDANDNSVLGVVQTNITGAFADWEKFSKKLPEAALGNTIKLEFRFISDDFDPIQLAGWYIDDVELTVP